MTVGLKQLPRHVSARCEVRQAAGNKPVRSAILDTYKLHEGDHYSILHQLHLRVRVFVRSCARACVRAAIPFERHKQRMRRGTTFRYEN